MMMMVVSEKEEAWEDRTMVEGDMKKVATVNKTKKKCFLWLEAALEAKYDFLGDSKTLPHFAFRPDESRLPKWRPNKNRKDMQVTESRPEVTEQARFVVTQGESE
jgi:hypothetical protein